MTTTFTVNAKLFEATYRFKSNEAARYNLGGVHVEKAAQGGVFMVATDGHRLFCAFDNAGKIEGDSIIITVDKDFLKLCAKTDSSNFIRYADGVMSLNGFDDDFNEQTIAQTSQAHEIDETYPDWRWIVPWDIQSLKGKQDHSTFNPKYIADFAKVAKDLSEGKQGYMMFHMGDSKGPQIITFDNRNAFGLVMPIREPFSPGLPFELNYKEGENAVPLSTQNS